MTTFLSRLYRSLRGHPCARCGGVPTKLVVDAVAAGKRIDGRTGMVTKTFRVESCAWLCPKCKEGSNESRV